jgi:Na+-translocating ferredoxin:NAD+ oxidoreductase subunit B
MSNVDTAYEKLIGALNARGTSMPAINCPEFFALMEEILTQHEAVIACAMPLGYSALEDIAENLKVTDLGRLDSQLETMADKGLIELKKENGKKVYQFLPLVPGIIEYQFMKGNTDEHSKKIAHLYRAYIKAMGSALRSAEPPKLVKSAPARKIPVDKGVTSQAAVWPYSVTKKAILDAGYIAAGACMCRHQGALLDKPCNKPSDNCMLFGETAKFAVARGFAKALTKDEAVKMLDAAEKAGLVHQYSYIPEHDYAVLCNCCSCHCSIMRGASKSPVPSQAVDAAYVIKIDDEACTGCESCIERCLMEALKMVDGKLTRDENRCIGCGLCMYVCPTEALSVGLRTAGAPK